MGSRRRSGERDNNLRKQSGREGLVRRDFVHIQSRVIPSPEEIKQYEDIVPGLGESIIHQWKDESHHRRTMEIEKHKTESRNSLLGIVFGFIIVIAALITGALLLFYDKDLYGLSLMIGSIVAPVIAFITGKIINKSENKKLAEIFQNASKQ